MKNLKEIQNAELTTEAKRLFKNGGNFETVYQGLKDYRKKNGLSHINNLDAVQYLAKKNMLTKNQNEIKTRIDKGDYLNQENNRLNWNSDNKAQHTGHFVKALVKIYGKAEYLKQLKIRIEIK